MASPWGAGTYPHPGPPGQYPPPQQTFPNEQRQQVQFPQPTIPGFYNPAVAQYQAPHAAYPGAISSQFNATMPAARIPNALQPGGGMIHRTPSNPNMRPNGPEFYYQQPPPPLPPMPSQFPPVQHHAPPLRHAQSVPPPLPHKPFNQPPLPPKPPLNTPVNGVPPPMPMYPQSIPSNQFPPQTSPTSPQAFSDVQYPARNKPHPPAPEARHHHTAPAYVHSQHAHNTAPPVPSFPNHVPYAKESAPDFTNFTPDVKESPAEQTPHRSLSTPPHEADEDEELRRVLEMSAKAHEDERRQALSQEDEEFERALRESLQVSHKGPSPSFVGLDAEPSHNVMFPSPETLSSPLPEPSTSQSTSPAFSYSTLPTSTYSHEPHEFVHKGNSTNPFTSSSGNNAFSQIADDEAFARKLMEEEEEREERERRELEDRERREREERERSEREERERLEKEESERRAREEQERRAREEQERRVREEQERRTREEQERRAREEQERRVREEQERREREERERRQRAQSQPPPIRPNEQPPPFEPQLPPQPSDPPLPLYDDVVSMPSPVPTASPGPPTATHPAQVISPASPNTLYAVPVHSMTPSPAHSRQPSPSPAPTPALGRSISAQVTNASPASVIQLQNDTRAARSQSFTAFGSSTVSPGLRPGQPSPILGAPQMNGSQQTSPNPSMASSNLAPVDERNEAPVAAVPQQSGSRPGNVTHVSDSILTANQFVDAELLRGISINFSDPSISAVLTPMQGPIPNVISLPFGRGKTALHIKAPSWRALLKLMARLSGTRLEPTLEDMAVVKAEMKLRVVVAFVKVHQSSSEWHVILYVTIDLPAPANSAAHRRGTDTNVLPFSYSVSPVPSYLRDGADAPMAKWYAIPETPQTGYPTLPISFPNLATYLLAALDESRRASQDNMRRLSKIIDTCYPTEQATEEGDQESSSTMGGIFSLFRRNRNRQTRDRNADTFDVVTPFVPDEWSG